VFERNILPSRQIFVVGFLSTRGLWKKIPPFLLGQLSGLIVFVKVEAHNTKKIMVTVLTIILKIHNN
jgi:hypothetical protein